MPSNADQRSTPRLHAKIAIEVDGRDRNKKPFREDSQTILVNDGGALIALTALLDVQDRIHVKNKSTGNTTECRVAWRSADPIQGRYSYGIAIVEAVENFWALDQKK